MSSKEQNDITIPKEHWAKAAGTVVSGQVESPALGVTKRFQVYLPDDYQENSHPYPVIYLLHGWGVTEDAWIGKSLDLPGTADRLKLQAIVVMPDGDRSFYVNSASPSSFDRCLRETSPQRNESELREAFCVRTPQYEDYVVFDLVPRIDQNFRTIPKREARALIGESGGGLAAMQLAMRHKDCGNQDELGFHDLARYFHDRLLANGIRHTFLSVPGHHDDSLWKVRLPFSLEFAIKQFTSADVYSRQGPSQ